VALTVLVSAKSSGVSVSALALALSAPGGSVLVEADPSGGTLRTGLLQASHPAAAGDVGLQYLAQADRAGTLAAAFHAHLYALDDGAGRRVMTGLTDPAQAAGLGRTWAPLAELLRELAETDTDVVVDAGRMMWSAGHLAPGFPAPLLHAADQVLLTVRSSLPSAVLAAHVVPALRAELAVRGAGEDTLGVLLVEEDRYRPHEVAGVLGLPVLAALPWDPPAAAYLSLGPGRGRRAEGSRLLRSARTGMDAVHAHVRGRLARLLPPAAGGRRG
jgi:hypothetical protein